MRGGVMLDEMLHLLYPRVCAGCHSLLVSGAKGICPECIATFDTFSDADAAGCAIKERFGHSCPTGNHPERAWSLYRFHKNDRLQRVIHAMKYEGVRRLGEVFGVLLAEMIAGSGADDRFGCIVPVPLHRLKVVERTYNQSEIIARSAAAILRKDVRPDLVIRKKYTRPQAGLSPQERQRNVKDAFAPSGNIVPENILLVDDVLTTGATAAAVMHALESAGAVNISLATVALAA